MNTSTNKKMWLLAFCITLCISIVTFAQNNQGEQTISRYEFTELLTSAECRDCLSPEQEIADTYTADRLQTIKLSPLIALDDIERTEQGPNTSWFYCVANVVDRGLMQGFPRTTSPYCPGKFCGTTDLTMIDFLDSLIRTLGATVREQYPINWGALASRAQGNPGLPINYLQAIAAATNRCEDKPCVATSRDEFAVRLQWCRTDAEACGLGQSSALGSLGPRRVVLQNAGVIPKDAQLTNAFAPVSRDLALQATQYVSGLLGCEENNGGQTGGGQNNTTGNINNGGLGNTGGMSGNTGSNNAFDQDGDGIPNIDDLCPQVYDPSQNDLDKDGIGDVCDDDIDGDGIKNSIGVVDHQGRFKQDLVRQSDDNCIIDPNPDQKNADGDTFGDLCQTAANTSAYRALQITGSVRSGPAPLTVQFSQETVSGTGPLLWDMGDGTVIEGLSPQHTYQTPGRYTVVAKTIGQKETIIAILPLVVYPAERVQVGTLMAVKSIDRQKANIAIQHVVVGDVQNLTLQGNGELQTVKPKEIATIGFDDGGVEQFVMQSYNTQGERVGLTRLSLDPRHRAYSHLLTTSLNNEVGKNITITTVASGMSANEISQIVWDLGDGVTLTSGSVIQYAWEKPGIYLVKQRIIFVDPTREAHENAFTLVIRPLIANQRPLMMTVDRLLKTTVDEFVFSLDLGDRNANSIRHCDWTFTANQRRFTTNAKEIFRFRYPVPGSYPVIAHCLTNSDIWFTAGLTVAVDQAEGCGNAVCDFDKDGIPDLCDDDIDGDGLKNRLTLLVTEPKDCALSHDLIEKSVRDDYFGQIKQGEKFDNCPFLPNPQQGDSNQNGYGNACDPSSGGETGGGAGDSGGTGDSDWPDQDDDGDGIDNGNDSCPGTPESGNGSSDADGCPEAPVDDENDNNNGDNGFVKIDTCTQCPCPEADYASSLRKGDRVRALLLDPAGKIIYRYTAPEIIDEDIPDKMIGIQ